MTKEANYKLSRNKNAEMQRMISVFLAFIMVFGMYLLPAAEVWAAENPEPITFSSSGPDGLLTDSDVSNKLFDEGLSYESTFFAILDESVKSIGNDAFFGCTGLTGVTIPVGVTSIGDLAFYGCAGLTSVTIPTGITNIGAMAFDGCAGLTSVTIPASVNSIGNAAFGGCTALTAINVSDGNSKYSTIDGVLFDDNKTLIACPAGKSGAYTIPNGTERIGDRAFFGCENLTNVTIPNTVLNIGAAAFGFCSNLTRVNIGNSVKAIGDSAFGSCINLTSAIIPDSVERIGYGAFHSCFSLANVIVPDNVTSIGALAFYLCTDLTDIVLGNSVEYIGYHAFFRTQIKTVTLPQSIQTLGFSAGEGEIEDKGVFSHMNALEKIVFETGTTKIPDNAFKGISIVDELRNLEIYIPKSVETISIESGLSSNTLVYAFAESPAEKYAVTNNIPHITMPTILSQVTEAPPAYQYIPYSIKFESSENSWLITKPGIEWPNGLNIAIVTDKTRVRGEIYGAPKDWGNYLMTIEATDGNIYPLKDEVTFEIDIAEYLRQSELERTINRGRLLRPMGVYNEEKVTYIVDVYTENPEDEILIFDCDFQDFIGLWLDGELLRQDEYDPPNPPKREGDYYAEPGSTKITVYGQTFLNLDPEIEHVIVGEFKAGGEAEGEHYTVAQDFWVNFIDRPKPSPPGGTGGGDGNASIPGTPPPLTSGGIGEEPPPTPPAVLPFIDVKETDWFFQDVSWVYFSHIMIGVSDNMFAPNDPINSAMIMTALSRMLKVDIDAFSGIADDKWYSKPIAWGKDIGLFDENGEINFEIPLDRGQVSIILAKLLRGAGVEANESESFNFSDIGLMSEEALDAFKLLYALGIMKGKGNGMMEPQSPTTRAELAAILHRADEHIDNLLGRYGILE